MIPIQPTNAGMLTMDQQSGPTKAPDDGRDPARMAAAREFEAMFLAQMLNEAGVGKTPEGFGGGQGEEAFASFLVQEYANLMAEQGGVGLADHIYRTMAGADGDNG